MRRSILVIAIALLAVSNAWGKGTRDHCGSGWGGGRWGNRLGNLEVVGLTADQRLICFDERHPNRAGSIGSVTGLVSDTGLVGIDFRPATGELYGLGNAGGIYVLDSATAVASLRSRLATPPAGTSFGVDFNPTVDRLRVVGDAGQNLRINVDTGVATVDTDLNYVAGTPAAGIAGAAYTNNDADPGTATTLFDLDAALDQIAIQAPPNAGSLNPTGKLALDAGAAVGFDIYSQLRNGAAQRVRALATLSTGDRTRLYRIRLLTGKAWPRGTFRASDAVIGIAIPPSQRLSTSRGRR